jgi:uncharacterized protein YndB with AHSA1/START domain
MARESTYVETPPESVWQVLADGRRYSDWVVGSKRVRDVDAGWPAPGTRIHHTVGIGPLVWDDDTEVLASEAPRRLLLEARLRPFGTARVELELTAEGGGTRVTMDEQPAAGPLARAHTRLSDLLLRVRNVESLRRLRRISRRDEDPPRRAEAGAHRGAREGASRERASA